MGDLTHKKCLPCEGIGKKYTDEEIMAQSKVIHKDWAYDQNRVAIVRTFHFKNYYEVLAFVNAVGWISHQEDHHPTLTVYYDHCEVIYNTHALGGVTENDFICASKVDALIVDD